MKKITHIAFSNSTGRVESLYIGGDGVSIEKVVGENAYDINYTNGKTRRIFNRDNILEIAFETIETQ